MTSEQKAFRKFFYENSTPIDGECVFAEITDENLVRDHLGLLG